MPSLRDRRGIRLSRFGHGWGLGLNGQLCKPISSFFSDALSVLHRCVIVFLQLQHDPRDKYVMLGHE